jgi:hypothetical protein
MSDSDTVVDIDATDPNDLGRLASSLDALAVSFPEPRAEILPSVAEKENIELKGESQAA